MTPERAKSSLYSLIRPNSMDNYCVLRDQFEDWGPLMSDGFFETYDQAETFARNLWAVEGVRSVICERRPRLEWERAEYVPF